MDEARAEGSPAALWTAYLASLSAAERSAAEKRGYTAWHFCADQRNADELGALTLAGVKRGTASSILAYEKEGQALPEIDDLSVITDWAGRALCLIKTTRLERKLFGEVGSEFAAREGEGDGSLEYWREGHRRYFGAEHAELGLPFDESIPVLCEEFEVVWPRAAVPLTNK
jgi:uncharacterized protein YhfF